MKLIETIEILCISTVHKEHTVSFYRSIETRNREWLIKVASWKLLAYKILYRAWNFTPLSFKYGFILTMILINNFILIKNLIYFKIKFPGCFSNHNNKSLTDVHCSCIHDTEGCNISNPPMLVISILAFVTRYHRKE